MMIHCRDAILCLLLTTGLCFWGMRLESADWSQPFSYGDDTLAMLPVVKETVERGTYRTTPRLGAPGTQQLYDFPISEPLHISVVWLIGKFVRDPIVTFNLFYPATFPLIALSTFFVLRNFSLSRSAAHCGAILFAFAPYHIGRGYAHYFLSAYYIVPLTAMILVWVARGRLPFFVPTINGQYRFTFRSRDTLIAMVIAAATATAGAYYAFFGCSLFVVAGLYGWLQLKTSRAFVSAWLIIGTIIAIGIVPHVPTFLYQSHFGKNSSPHARTSEEAESYPLKITHLVMPIAGHNSRNLANIQRAYDSHTRLQQNENKTTALGAIGTIGFAVLMVVAVFPIGQTSILRPLGVLTAACVLIGIAGGIGSLFAFFVSPQIRAYNRIAIYIAFFSLAASCGLVDRLIRGRGSNFRIPVFVLIVAFGLWDQTGNGWFRSKIANDRYVVATESRTDAEFFSSWEQTNANGTVFCLPFVSFPESNHSGTLSGYDHARGYLHTKTARWSYGAMKGREDDQWQREVVLRPALQMLDAIIFRGFDTIFIDLRGYEGNLGVEKQKELMASLGVDCPVRIHPDGKQFLYDLRPYCERRRRELGAEYDRLAKRENDDVRFLWLDGFVSFQNVGEEWKHRLCQTSGILVVVNPSNETRTLVVDAIFRTDLASDSQLEIDGEIWRESLTISRNTQPSQRTLTIPPGRNHVSFRCKLSREYMPYDSRRLAFFMAHFRTS